MKYLDDIMNDDVNETIIEAEEVEDRTGDGILTFSSDQEGAYLFMICLSVNLL